MRDLRSKTKEEAEEMLFHGIYSSLVCFASKDSFYGLSPTEMAAREIAKSIEIYVEDIIAIAKASDSCSGGDADT